MIAYVEARSLACPRGCSVREQPNIRLAHVFCSALAGEEAGGWYLTMLQMAINQTTTLTVSGSPSMSGLVFPSASSPTRKSSVMYR